VWDTKRINGGPRKIRKAKAFVDQPSSSQGSELKSAYHFKQFENLFDTITVTSDDKNT
jgi:hypothetical protein